MTLAGARPRLLLVAMNYAPELSGTAPYTTTWAQHLSRRADVLVLAGVPHYPQWQIHDGYGRWSEEGTEYGVRVRRLRHHVPARTTPAHRVAHEASFGARVLTQRLPRPDAVLAVSPPLFGAGAAGRLARRFGVPFGLVVQDLYGRGATELGHRGPAADRLGELESRIVAGADAVVTISDRFRSVLTSQLGVSEQRITVVGNWSSVPVAPATRQAVRVRMGWQREFVALHAGNIGAKQGLENIVEAARLADRDQAPVRFVLVGDGNARASVAARAAGVQRLTMLPSASPREHAGLLAAADVLLVNEVPGVAEMSLPSKLTSYFAAGRAVLAATGAEGATAELLRRSGAGVRVDPADAAALLDAVLDLRNHPDAAATHAALGQRYSSRHQSLPAAMRAYDDWVDHLLAGATSAVGARRPLALAGPPGSH